jgi:hypothetical protein
MTATDDQYNLWAEASISHRNPRDVDVETLLHQLRNSDIRVSAALAAENLGGPVEKYLAVTDRAWQARAQAWSVWL